MLEKLGITPGPWELRSILRGTPHDVVTDKDGWSGHIICSGWGDESKEPELRLIAAAPEMLEALIEYIRLMEGVLESGQLTVKGIRSMMKLYEHYASIIEKATGLTWAELKDLIC